MKRIARTILTLSLVGLYACPTTVPDVPGAPMKVAPVTPLACELTALLSTEASAPSDFAVAADDSSVATAFFDSASGLRVEVATTDGLNLGALVLHDDLWRPAAVAVDDDRVVVAARTASRHRAALLVGRIGSGQLEVAWEVGDDEAPDAQRDLLLTRDGDGAVVVIDWVTASTTAAVRSVDGTVRGEIAFPFAPASLVASAQLSTFGAGTLSPSAALSLIRVDVASLDAEIVGRAPVVRLSNANPRFCDANRPTLTWLSADGEVDVFNTLADGIRRHAVIAPELGLEQPSELGPTAVMGQSLLVADGADRRRWGIFWVDESSEIESASYWAEGSPGIAEAATSFGDSEAIVVTANYHGDMATNVVVSRLQCSIAPIDETP